MKIALAGCNGMSPNGLISRAAVYDSNNELENTISICMGATSGGNKHLNELIKKYPIIAVNGCKNECVNTILKEKRVLVEKTINIDEELEKTKQTAKNTVRLDENDEECVKTIKKAIQNKINEINKT